jgi:hypothetical protein
MNPLKSLIRHYLRQQNINRSELALGIGYTNITKALRRIDNFIADPTISNPIKSKLQHVLKIPDDEIDFAIEQQQQILIQKAEQNFKPIIQVNFSSKPSPIFAAQFFLNICIPKHIRNLNYEDELLHVFELYKADQLAKFEGTVYVDDIEDYDAFVDKPSTADSNYIEYFWGIGNGYTYHRSTTESLTFDRFGNQYKSTYQAPKTAHIKVKNKPIPLMFFN